jgi:hypothetical protein
MKVGITGHQDLGVAQDWCHTVVEDLIRTLPVTHGYTSLAAGADQLFADILAAEKIPFTVVIPCQDYEQAFASDALRNRYLYLLDKAAERTTLAFDHPSSEAFMAAGRHVVGCIETLIAIWDGRAAKGLGGTADIVAFARAQGVPVWHCNPVARAITSDEWQERQG